MLWPLAGNKAESRGEAPRPQTWSSPWYTQMVPNWQLPQLAGTDFFSTHAQSGVHQKYVFLAGVNSKGFGLLRMEEKVYWKLWVELGCSLRCTQIIAKMALGGPEAGAHLLNMGRSTRIIFISFCQERIHVVWACLVLQGKLYWTRECLYYTQMSYRSPPCALHVGTLCIICRSHPFQLHMYHRCPA